MTNKKSNRQIYTAVFIASLDYLDDARNFVRGLISDLGYGDYEINQIILAVDEAFTNAARHAYVGKSGKIDIRVEITKNKLKISVIDYGRGFDPEKVEKKDIKAYIKKLKRGGLGLYLIRNLMDKVEYKLNPGVKNEILMIKELKRA